MVIDDFAHHPTRDRRDAARSAAALPGTPRVVRARAALVVAAPQRVPGQARRRLRSTPTRSSSRRCSAPTRLPPESGSIPPASSRTSRAAGVRPLPARGATRSSRTSRPKRAGTDVVAVLSNGGFGGIHGKLLRRARRPRNNTGRRPSAAGPGRLPCEGSGSRPIELVSAVLVPVVILRRGAGARRSSRRGWPRELRRDARGLARG